ncbi:hypothetical protein RhiirA4_457620 [Rhizophagus irregularis]|uniref:Uncharacterized protein n=1 Tax=Rhizophagus irregularis TaxID=588596 RepID=A0A2I1GAG3_9GLOM|nr:hypothetical protein RhiirA4_457620 [Rhizophagus irregularis]
MFIQISTIRSCFNRNFTKWKIIVYFKDQKSTEAAVEESLEQGSLERVWKVRNFKKRESGERENGQCERDFTESHLDTPPQRIYSELGSIIVDEIDKYRKGVEDDAPISTVASKKLQKDYVTTDEADKMADVTPKYDELKEAFVKCEE